ncbi:MAG: adenosylcobinamide-GDP ribazoletransferase [Acidimicrobiales bacterium]
MTVVTPLRSAFGFLTVFGTRATSRPDARATGWFPLVGAVVGLAVGGVWWGAGELWPPLVAATIAVALDAGLTGMLHLDGLADTADGLLPPIDRDRRLDVMADPRAGGFAVVTVTLVLGLRVAALASMDPDPVMVAGLWALARAAMTLTLARVPYARPEGGLASSFVGARPWPGMGGSLVGAMLVVAAMGVPAGPAVASTTLVGAGLVVWLAWRRLGGFTGDVLGAAGVVGETVGLLAAAARW